jgi:hypothetical protein
VDWRIRRTACIRLELADPVHNCCTLIEQCHDLVDLPTVYSQFLVDGLISRQKKAAD